MCRSVSFDRSHQEFSKYTLRNEIPRREGNAVKLFLGSYRRQTVVNRDGGYLRPRSGERSYDMFVVIAA